MKRSTPLQSDTASCCLLLLTLCTSTLDLNSKLIPTSSHFRQTTFYDANLRHVVISGLCTLRKQTHYERCFIKDKHDYKTDVFKSRICLDILTLRIDKL